MSEVTQIGIYDLKVKLIHRWNTRGEDSAAFETMIPISPVENVLVRIQSAFLLWIATCYDVLHLHLKTINEEYVSISIACKERKLYHAPYVEVPSTQKHDSTKILTAECACRHDASEMNATMAKQSKSLRRYWNQVPNDMHVARQNNNSYCFSYAARSSRVIDCVLSIAQFE